jgi:hypothetical protein
MALAWRVDGHGGWHGIHGIRMIQDFLILVRFIQIVLSARLRDSPLHRTG